MIANRVDGCGWLGPALEAGPGLPSADSLTGNNGRTMEEHEQLQVEMGMAKYGNITFSGKSGEKYCFHAWPLETRFKSLGGVFFVTKRVYKNKTYDRACHEPVYIGETSNLADPFGTQSQLDCFKKHGGNCVCVYVAANEERRRSVEQDLIAGHSTSCNE